MRLGSRSGLAGTCFILAGSLVGACAPDEASEAEDGSTLEWRVESTPIATVGLDESVQAEIFGSVSSAQLLRGDGFVVLDGQSREVRAFSSSGTHLWTAGGQGGGPSEFGYATEVGVRPDSTIDVPDLGAWKIVRFSAEGDFLESTAIQRGSAYLTGAPRVPMSEGTIPVMGGEERAMAPTPGVSFAEATLIVSLLRPDSVEEVFRSPGGQGFQKTEDGRLRGGILPFGRIMAWDSGRSLIVAGNGHLDPTVISESGTSRQIPSPFSRIAVSESLKNQLLASRDEDRALYAEVLRSPVIPDSTASYDRLWIDSSDRIWIRQYQVAPTEHRWAIVDSEGTVLGRLSLPLNARFLDATDSHVLIRRETDLGVQYVELRAVASVGAQAPSI